MIYLTKCENLLILKRSKNKHHLFDDDHLNDEEILQLEDFRLAIRGSEIESVALFKLEVSSDFEYYIKPSQNQTIEDTH